MQQLVDRTSTVQGPVCGGAGNPAIATTNGAPVSYAGKRAFDVVAATAGLVLSSPMFLLVSIAIKIDSRDPVFQPQMLHGYIQL
jgi:lipopolysaccharide/colanic/teichoic acid biosynthesis glycosyltransferase